MSSKISIVLTLILLQANCRREDADRSELLKGPEWVVIDVNGAPSVGSGSRATLKFDDATVSGRAFCNYYTATYATTGKKLSIHLTSMTNMACLPETREELFTDLLGAV